jgi:hypothetical protein
MSISEMPWASSCQAGRGEPRVNVLLLNLALERSDGATPR